MSRPEYILADTAKRTARKAWQPATGENLRCFPVKDAKHRQRIVAELESKGYKFAWPKSVKHRLPAPRLAAVTCFYNPAGFHTLRANYDQFAEQFEADTAPPLFTVEIALSGQDFSIPAGDRVLQLRAKHPLWFKENAINIAATRHDFIPDEFTAIAWLDCDLIFENPDWHAIAAEKLRDVPAVQCFRTITHLDRNGEPQQTRKGVVAHLAELDHMPAAYGDHPPGGAWAAHREFFERFRLYEGNVNGGGDAMVHSAMMQNMEPGYLRLFENELLESHFQKWAEPVARHVRGQVDFVPGHIRHLWHGDKVNRQYKERCELLADFNPETDIHHNEKTNLLEWATDKPEMHRRHVEYFEKRKEDG